MIKKQKKFSDTSIRVMETLKILANKPASIQDILNHFEKIDPKNRIYTSEVILKYINTLKVFGMRFTKKKDKYILLTSPCELHFSKEDLQSIALLEKYSRQFPEEKIKTEIDKFIQEIEKRFSDTTKLLANNIKKPTELNFSLSYEKYSARIKEYEKYCLEAQRLKVTCKDSKNKQISITIDPNELKYKGEKVYLSAYNPLLAQIQDINLDDIISITQLPTKSNPMNMLSAVTFKLKGTLAKTYKLHADEKLIQIEKDGNIIILNQKEDRRLLLKRLMRYGENCEVISPKSLRDEMAELIEETLKLYL